MCSACVLRDVQGKREDGRPVFEELLPLPLIPTVHTTWAMGLADMGGRWAHSKAGKPEICLVVKVTSAELTHRYQWQGSPGRSPMAGLMSTPNENIR